MKNVFASLLFIFLSLWLEAQAIIPLSRQDSADIENNNELYKHYLQAGNKKEAARYLDLNAVIYWKHNYFDSAIDYYTRSLELNRQLGNLNGIAGINSNLALIYADKGDYEKAYDFFEKTLAVRKSRHESVGIISALINESVVLNKLKRFDQAVAKLEEALTYAREMNDEKEMRNIYGMLSETYQKAGNVKKAMYYYQYYKTFNDYVTQKVVNETEAKLREERLKKRLLELENENKKLLLQKQKFLLSRQTKKIGKLTQEQKRLLDSLSAREMAMKIIQQKKRIADLENKQLLAEKKRQQQIITVISVALVILLALLLWLYRIYKQKDKLYKLLIVKNSVIKVQNEEIKAQRDEMSYINKQLVDKNKEITDSINYAKSIQKSVLSKSDLLYKMFTDAFLIYKPKHIVSGDFYYFRKIGELKLVVVGDCTGHGVPGAFLTMLAINVLNSIVYKDEYLHPDKIVKELDLQFYKMLKDRTSYGYEGMDVGVCIVNEDNSALEYSGARMPLVMVSHDKIRHIKPVRHSIGGFSDIENPQGRHFKSEIVTVNGRQWVYMYSDGIKDMMTPDNRKYGQKRLFEAFRKVYSLNGKEQYEFFVKEIETWQGVGNEQIDDIVIVGFLLDNQNTKSKENEI